jgi:hypothetical protein
MVIESGMKIDRSWLDMALVQGQNLTCVWKLIYSELTTLFLPKKVNIR